MDVARARANLARITPKSLERHNVVRAYNTRVKTHFGREYFFDSTWSYERGYRYNFKQTHPVLYLAEDPIVAAAEIGPRTRRDLLVPRLHAAADPYLYVTVRVTGNFLDVTDAATRDLLAVNEDELLIPTEEWDDNMEAGIWSATHEIGRLALSDSRFDGIIYSSYPVTRLLETHGDCLAVFMDPVDPMARPFHPSVQLDVIDPRGVLATLGIRV